MNHLTPEEISEATVYGESFRRLVDNQQLPDSIRTRASVACLGIAQDHHHGILLLLSNSLYASAFALARPTFESYIRGQWLTACASDAWVSKFVRGMEPPRIGTMIAELEATATFDSAVRSRIHRDKWNALCGYTHSGGIHAQRWQSGTTIQPCYEREEVLEVLEFAEMISGLSTIGILTQSSDLKAAEAALEIFRQRFQ